MKKYAEGGKLPQDLVDEIARKENEEVWQEFRAMCDDFFAQKKAFFGTIQEKFTKIGDQKQALVDQAIAIKDSTDWKATGEKLVALQKQWKTIGHAGQKLEQKLLSVPVTVWVVDE
jgi:hypothetical protein